MNTVPGSLPCRNCNKQMGQEDIRLFRGVGVCTECYEVADLIMRRGQAELRHVRTVMGECIRTALAEGTLHLPRGNAPPTKSEVLSMIMTMKEVHDRGKRGPDGG